jgi:hypothetical protein
MRIQKCLSQSMVALLGSANKQRIANTWWTSMGPEPLRFPSAKLFEQSRDLGTRRLSSIILSIDCFHTTCTTHHPRTNQNIHVRTRWAIKGEVGGFADTLDGTATMEIASILLFSHLGLDFAGSYGTKYDFSLILDLLKGVVFLTSCMLSSRRDSNKQWSE